MNEALQLNQLETRGNNGQEFTINSLPTKIVVDGVGTLKVAQLENSQMSISLVSVDGERKIIAAGVPRAEGDTLAIFPKGVTEKTVTIDGIAHTLKLDMKYQGSGVDLFSSAVLSFN